MDKTKVEINGTKRQRHGGRAKGTPNKSTEYLFELAKKNNFDVAETMMYIAMGAYEKLGLPEYEEKQGYQGVLMTERSITIDHRLEALKQLMGYMYPKRKAIELSGSAENNNMIVMSYDPSKLKKNEG